MKRQSPTTTAALLEAANPENPRTISQAARARLAKQLAEFGDLSSVVWNRRTGHLVCGHQRTGEFDRQSATVTITQRLPKANACGTIATGQIDCQGESYPYREVDWSAKKERQAMLAANNSAGEWDDELLAELLKEFSPDEIDLAGFDADDLKGLDINLQDLINKPESQTSALNEAKLKLLVDKWKPQAGQVWQLGQHRLAVGSATDKKLWAKLMRTDLANLVFTDPPYGVSYESASTGSIKNDGLRRNDLTNLLKPAFDLMARYSQDNAAFYIWHASSTRRDFEWAIQQAALEEQQYLTWVKDSFVMGHADYHWQTEPCFYCQKAGQKSAYFGDRKQSTVWRITHCTPADGSTINLANGIHLSDGQASNLYLKANTAKNGKKLRHIRLDKGQSVLVLFSIATDAWEVKREATTDYFHPNQKPPELAIRAILNSTAGPESMVIDCFAGSGSTLIACERTA